MLARAPARLRAAGAGSPAHLRRPVSSLVASGPASSIVFVATILPGRSRCARRAGRDVAPRRPRHAARPDARRVPPVARRVSRSNIRRSSIVTSSSPAPPVRGMQVDAQTSAARLRGAGQGSSDSPAAGLDRGGWTRRGARRPARRIGRAAARAARQRRGAAGRLDGPTTRARAARLAADLDEAARPRRPGPRDDPETAPALIPRLPDYLRAAEDSGPSSTTGWP